LNNTKHRYSSPTKYLQEKIPVGENYLIEKERRIKQFKASFDNKKKKEKIKALESDSEGEMSDGETPYLLLCLNNGNKTQNIRIYVIYCSHFFS